MKALLRIGIILLGIGVTFTVYAANPASKEYVEQIFSPIQQKYTDIQQQLNNLNI